MSKGNSRKYASDLSWRDLARLLESLGKDHKAHICWTVEPCGLVPFSVRVTARSYRSGDAFMQELPVAISRTTLGAPNIAQIFVKLYWLAWDIHQQLENREAAQREDKESVPLPRIG